MNKHVKELKNVARKFAHQVVPARMGEPDLTGGAPKRTEYILELHKKLTYVLEELAPKMELDGSDKAIEKFYEEKRTKLWDEVAEDRFKALAAKDKEMKRRSEFVKGAFRALFQPEYQGKLVDWDTKITSEIEGHEGIKLKVWDYFDGDFSREWRSDNLDDTQRHLIDRWLGERIRYYFPGGSERKIEPHEAFVYIRLRIPAKKS